MGKKVLLVVPEAPAGAAAAAVTARKIKKGELRLGILDNSKSNADHLLHFVAEAIRAAMPVKSVLSLRKANVSLPAPDDVLNRFAAETDFVVSAMAD